MLYILLLLFSTAAAQLSWDGLRGKCSVRLLCDFGVQNAVNSYKSFFRFIFTLSFTTMALHHIFRTDFPAFLFQ